MDIPTCSTCRIVFLPTLLNSTFIYLFSALPHSVVYIAYAYNPCEGAER